MSDENNRPEDDAYVLEDDGSSIEQIEREMQETAQAAAADPPAAEEAAATVEQDLREFRDRYLRTLADFENYRKRADREKADYFKYAMAGVIKDLLPVLDNFDRALEHAEEGDDFHKGVSLIYKQLFDVLRRHGLRVIEESKVKFDPNIHEAVVTEEDASLPNHTVTTVLQKGYFLHDRLLRPAMVKVAVGGPEE
ncbi:MAG TPA: nucleotide exchange factor GrpE [Thermoanaerobaculia bacterium]|nr:nucleotide exchange factor GrpE [Thermoanaerobaculia bacterium]